jgi:hypothetical protein
MTPIQTSQFPLPKNAYASFDAASIKQQIKDRLNQTGVFTDQQYEGSNLSALTDVIALVFNGLLFYLNRTSTESMYTEASLYENMNRIVKAMDYKPVGIQSCTTSFRASADDIDAGLYTIPRYSFVKINEIPYSVNEDITFTKVDDNAEELSDFSNQKLLYQGAYEEYPLVTAKGEANELVYISLENTIVDHFNIDVYVKESDGIWYLWKSTPSLFLEGSLDRKYEYRFNENKRYELRFGNDVNGKQLTQGDQVAIYFLKSSGKKGEIGSRALNGVSLNVYDTLRYKEILADVSPNVRFITNTQSRQITFDNYSPSTAFSPEESVADIRKNAPGVFRSQYRLVTPNDYASYVKTNFAHVVHDVQVVNNVDYLRHYYRYFYDLGLTAPQVGVPVLHNQVQFSDACNFNNVYLIIVPKHFSSVRSTNGSLTPAQKELIQSSIDSIKTLTSEVVLLDPIYTAVSIALGKSRNTGTHEDIDLSQLCVVKSHRARRDKESIQEDVKNVFVRNFDKGGIKLGGQIDLTKITAEILSIDGVKTFYTQRTDEPTIKYEGLGLLVWNPIYKNDSTLTFKNFPLPFYKYPYFRDLDQVSTKIKVIDDLGA